MRGACRSLFGGRHFILGTEVVLRVPKLSRGNFLGRNLVYPPISGSLGQVWPSSSRPMHHPGTGVQVTQLGTDTVEEETTSPRSFDFEYDTGLKVNVGKPQTPCFSNTSDDFDTNNDCYSEYSGEEALLAQVTDDGYRVVESIEGTIKSKSNDDASESDYHLCSNECPWSISTDSMILIGRPKVKQVKPVKPADG